MPDVAVREEGAAVADRRDRSAAGRAGIERDAFADDAVGADRQRTRLALVFQILRLMADRGERKNARAGTDLRRSGDGDVA